MGSSHFIIYAILLVIVTECKEMNRCGIKGTYYSTIINDCVQCPTDPSGCTARLNNETLRNCLENCTEYFQISSHPTDPTTQFVARQIMGSERTGVMIAMAGLAVLLLIAGVLVLLVCVCKRRKHSSYVELGRKNWVERRTENPSVIQPPSFNLQKEEEGEKIFEEKIVNPLLRPIQENKNISPEIDPKGYFDKK